MKKPNLPTPVKLTEADHTQLRGCVRRKRAAEYIGSSVAFLEKGTVRGHGAPPYMKLSPRLVVYDVAKLDAWLAEYRVLSSSA